MTTLATLMKRYTLWKAQQGATVAELEQYQASDSLPNTLKMIVLLRAFSWASFVLVFIWVFYYLGSQAVSREYTFQSMGTHAKANTNLAFLSSSAPSAFNTTLQPSNIDMSRINVAFSTALLESGPVGQDRNFAATIPMLNRTESAQWPTNPPSSSKGHRLSGDASATALYSSAVGISLLPVSFVGSVKLSTSYIFANCADALFGTSADFPNGMLPTLTTAFNVTSNNDDGFPQVQIWKRNDAFNTTITSLCTLETRNVLLNILCDTKACAAVEYRPAVGKSAPTPADPFTDNAYSQIFYKNLMLSDSIPSSQSEQTAWETGATVTYSTSDHAWEDPQLSTDPADLAWALSYDLTRLTNTYLQVTQQWGPHDQPTFTAAGKLVVPASNATWSTAACYGAFYSPQYVLSIPWVVVDLLTCIIVLVAAMISCWLRVHTVAPDIFGCKFYHSDELHISMTKQFADVSSLARDNPNLNLPDNGVPMSGIQRAKSMKHIRVRIADVDGNGAGLAVVDSDVQMRHLAKAKDYA
jgi:hypothetical protein